MKKESEKVKIQENKSIDFTELSFWRVGMGRPPRGEKDGFWELFPMDGFWQLFENQAFWIASNYRKF